MIKKVGVILVISLLVVSSFLLPVNAGNGNNGNGNNGNGNNGNGNNEIITGRVWTTGDNDPDAIKMKFAIGETVFIFYGVEPEETKVDIYIEKSIGDKFYFVGKNIEDGKAQWVVPDELSDDIPIQLHVAVYDHKGNGVAYAPFATCTITITVVPESALGTIALIGATFAGFGLVKYRKNKLN